MFCPQFGQGWASPTSESEISKGWPQCWQTRLGMNGPVQSTVTADFLLMRKFLTSHALCPEQFKQD
jgi:hypothetical protein